MVKKSYLKKEEESIEIWKNLHLNYVKNAYDINLALLIKKKKVYFVGSFYSILNEILLEKKGEKNFLLFKAEILHKGRGFFLFNIE